MHRFGGPNPRLDSTQQTEDLGSDAVEATRLGMANLERVAGYLVEATSKPGEDYDLLENMYDEMWAKWGREMGHVANVVGGVEQINLFFGDADQRFFPNKPEYQRRALDFLLNRAFRMDGHMTPENVVRRISAEGVADSVLSAQQRLISSLISPDRINRISSYAERSEGEAFTAVELFSSMREGLFSEFQNGDAVGLYRRNVQRAYIDHLSGFLKNPSSNSDLPALARAELNALKGSISARNPGEDLLQSAHQMDLVGRIERALDPEP